MWLQNDSSPVLFTFRSAVSACGLTLCLQAIKREETGIAEEKERLESRRATVCVLSAIALCYRLIGRQNGS